MDGHSEGVSVVIPTYNRASDLPGAIDSVLAQTYDPIEIVVIDDGSTDQTSEVVSTYETDIKYHRFEQNQGANAARNMGIELADGKYVAFLDTDDRWKRKKIERQVAAFAESGPECGLVHTGIERRDREGEQIDRRIPSDPENPRRRLLLGNFVGTYSCVLLKTTVFEAVGTPDESLPSWQDWEFYLRVADEYEFSLIPEPLTVKRAGSDDQISRNIDPLLNETYPRFRSIIYTRATEFGKLFRRRAMAMLNKEVGDACLMNDRRSDARKFLRAALLQYPFEPKFYIYYFVSLGGSTGYRYAGKVKKIVSSIIG